MGIRVSLILIAVGAVLAFAVHLSGFHSHTIGVILLVVGAVSALISLIFWSSWGGFGGTRRESVVHDRY